MQIGDSYTFIRSEPIMTESGKPLAVGDYLSKWFRTNEPGRVFQVVAARGATYETVFVGFQIIDPETRAISVRPSWRHEDK